MSLAMLSSVGLKRYRVKAMGVLFFVIPIGAFVEPDEEEVNKAASWAKDADVRCRDHE